MPTITIENKWLETARLFGDITGIVKEALKSFFISQCKEKINISDEKIDLFMKKYHCSYPKFKKLVQTDDFYLKKIESENPMWEQDAIEWEFWSEEKETWNSQLLYISNL